MSGELATFRGASIVGVDPSAIAAAELVRAKVESKFTIALKFPRDISQFEQALYKECERPGFAEQFEYSKPIGKTNIYGVSIRGVETMLRLWRNADIEKSVVFEDENIRRVHVSITDYETNVSSNTQINVPKTVERKDSTGREVVGERINTKGEKVYIVKATADETQILEASLVSKAIRNEGLRLIPADIVERARQLCNDTLHNKDAKDPDDAKRTILGAFAKIGVMPQELAKYLGHSTDQLVVAEIADLRKIYQAIRSGEARWTDYINPVGGDSENTEPKKSVFEKKADSKKKKEATNEVVDTTAVHLEKEDKIPMESHPKSETSASDIPINIGHLEGYFRAQGMLPFTQPISSKPELLQKVRENLSQYVDLVNEWKEQNGIKN